jgi:hypothetical protein
MTRRLGLQPFERSVRFPEALWIASVGRQSESWSANRTTLNVRSV